MESYCVDTYYQALNLGTQLEFKTLYYKYLSNDGLTINTLNNNSLQTANEKMSDSTKVNIYKPHVENYTKMRNKEDFLYKFINNKFANIKNLPKVNFILNNKYNDLHENLNNNLNSIYATSKYNNNLNTNTAFYDYDQIDDLSNFAGNMDQQTNTKPLFFVRGVLNTHVTEILTNNFEKNNILNKDDILSHSLNKLKQFNTIFKLKKTIEKKEEISLYENLIEANMYANKIKYIKPVEVVKPIKPIKPIETKRINLQQFKNFIGNVTINTFDVLKEKNTLNKPLLFNILFNNNSGAVQKIDDNELLWGFRQKKYKRFKKFFFSNKINYDPNTLLPIKTEKNVARQLKNNMITNFEKYDDVKNIEYHNSVKFNRHRSELVPVNLARRLLRTKRTLVLPAHVNITLISNSYDVVHS